MRTSIALLAFLLRLAVPAAAPAADTEPKLPPEVAAVQHYVLNEEYPELFNDQPYRVSLEDVLIADLDQDGRDEVVALSYPHYLQSPPIVIYRFDKAGKVVRVREGLAPGPLLPRVDDYLDSHTLGAAVDMELGGQQGDPAARQRFIETALKEKAHIVAYRTFFHMDFRKGRGGFIDMTHVAAPPPDHTCEKIQFARVRQIAAGHPAGSLQADMLLAAWVGEELYLYSIKGFTADGLLDKALRVQPAPPGFTGFLPGQGLAYRTKDGATTQFALSGKPRK